MGIKLQYLYILVEARKVLIVFPFVIGRLVHFLSADGEDRLRSLRVD